MIFSSFEIVDQCKQRVSKDLAYISSKEEIACSCTKLSVLICKCAFAPQKYLFLLLLPLPVTEYQPLHKKKVVFAFIVHKKFKK